MKINKVAALHTVMAVFDHLTPVFSLWAGL